MQVLKHLNLETFTVVVIVVFNISTELSSETFDITCPISSIASNQDQSAIR